MKSSRLLFCAFIASALTMLGCNQCLCTLEYCADGIFISAPTKRDAGTPDFDLAWVDNNGRVISAQAQYGDWFIDLRDLPGRIEQIELRMFNDDGNLVAQETHKVTWTSTVCNQCGPDCDDILAYTASIEVSVP